MPATRHTPDYTLRRGDTHPISQPPDGRVVINEKTQKLKRPRNAFIFFRSHFHNTHDDYSKLDQGNLSRQAGSIWANMSQEQKAPFVKMAEEEANWYKVNYPEFAFTKRKAKREKAVRTSTVDLVGTQPDLAGSSVNPPFPMPEYSAQWATSAFPFGFFDEASGYQDEWTTFTDDTSYQISDINVGMAHSSNYSTPSYEHDPYIHYGSNIDSVTPMAS